MSCGSPMPRGEQIAKKTIHGIRPYHRNQLGNWHGHRPGLRESWHKVAATMRTPHRAPELARIATQEKLPITISAMDVDSDASVTEGIGRIVKEGGPVDVLVNNAGIERTGSVEETPLAEFRAVMETNYF